MADLVRFARFRSEELYQIVGYPPALLVLASEFERDRVTDTLRREGYFAGRVHEGVELHVAENERQAVGVNEGTIVVAHRAHEVDSQRISVRGQIPTRDVLDSQVLGV